MQSLFGVHWQSSPPADIMPSSALYAWLVDPASLTEKVRSICHQDFSVEVIYHQNHPAPECALSELSIAPGTALLHREVLLCDGQTPLVFASSVLPVPALTGRFADIQNLGTRPLGHWLFAEPVLKRSSMRYVRLASSAALFARLKHLHLENASLPGRKTLFTGADLSLIHI